MFKAVIVEDELHSRETLKNMIQKYCSNVEVVDEADCVERAHPLIMNCQPDVVFLDIQLKNGNGFELLDKFEKIDFEIIFTTAYDNYAVRAFRMAALDYLLKPINIEELKVAVGKLDSHRSFSAEKYNAFKHFCGEPSFEKLMLPTSQGFVFVSIDDILYLKADNNYTEFYFGNRKPLVVCRTLLDYEEMLHNFWFHRIHHKYLINMRKVEEFNNHENYVLMSDGTTLFTSTRKKADFIKRLQLHTGVSK